MLGFLGKFFKVGNMKNSSLICAHFGLIIAGKGNGNLNGNGYSRLPTPSCLLALGSSDAASAP